MTINESTLEVLFFFSEFVQKASSLKLLNTMTPFTKKENKSFNRVESSDDQFLGSY
jgi:hypothetical protein